MTQPSDDLLKSRVTDLGTGVSGPPDAAPDGAADGPTARPYVPGPPLHSLSPDQLRHAFVENLFELFRSMGHLPGGVVEERSVVSRHHAPVFNPMFHGFWAAQVPQAGVDAAIDDAVSWLREREAPFGFWWVDVRTAPADLEDRLLAAGWEAWERQAPGMAAVLEDLDFDALGRVPAGYSQELVTDERGLADFERAFIEGFGVPDWAGKAWSEATLAFGVTEAPWRMFVGRIDARPVSTTMLFLGAGVASVFGVATLPEVRGQGIGAAVTLAAFEEAKRLGFSHGVLFATELGAPVYRRIGFSDVGASISRFLWRP